MPAAAPAAVTNTAAQPAARHEPPAAARLADALKIPVTLPVGHRGTPIANLSHSSLMRWTACPDDWRRHYLLGERGPQTGAMFLGNRVDDAITTYFWLRKAGQTLSLEQLRDAFRDLWQDKLADERPPVAWEPQLAGGRAMRIGLDAIDITYEQLIPRLGEPTDTQRAFALRLAPQLAWTINGYVDLDTTRSRRLYVDREGDAYAIQDSGEAVPTVTMAYADAPADLRRPVKIGRTAHAPQQAIDVHRTAVEEYEQALARIEQHGIGQGEKAPRAPRALPDIAVPVDRLQRFGDVIDATVHGIVDYKVTNTLRSPHAADTDPQASLYLAERWLHAEPCHDLRFAQVGKPGSRRQQMTTALVATTRSPGQMRAVLLRYAVAAAQITAAYDAFGPDQPWGFADEGHWKCQPDPDSVPAGGGQATRGRFCWHYASCPCGAGLSA